MKSWAGVGVFLVLFCLLWWTTRPAESESREIAGGEDKITIVHWVGDYAGFPEAFEEIARKFEATMKEKTDRDIQVSIIYQPVNGYSMWFDTRLKGGTPPDIAQNFPGTAIRYGLNKHLLPLTEYLGQPNPFASDPKKKWVDFFYPSVMEETRDNVVNDYWSIPTTQVSLRVYYNRNIFRHAGIDVEEFEKMLLEDGRLPPSRKRWTWSAFMDLCRAIDNAPPYNGRKITPFAMECAPRPSYVLCAMRWIRAMLLESLVAKVDKRQNLYRDRSGKIARGPDGRAQGEETLVACYKAIRSNGQDPDGISINDEEVREVLRFVMEWAQFFSRGATGTDEQQAQFLFVNEFGAMRIDGSWKLQSYRADIGDSFQFGIMRFPLILPGDSKYADGIYSEPSGADVAFCVTAKTKERGNHKLAIDFLRFMTAPDNMMVLAEKAWVIPTQPDIPVARSDLEIFRPVYDPEIGTYGGIDPFAVSAFANSRFASYLQMLIGHYWTLEEFMDTYYPIWENEVKIALQDSHEQHSIRLRLAHERCEDHRKELLMKTKLLEESRKTPLTRERVASICPGERLDPMPPSPRRKWYQWTASQLETTDSRYGRYLRGLLRLSATDPEAVVGDLGFDVRYLEGSLQGDRIAIENITGVLRFLEEGAPDLVPHRLPLVDGRVPADRLERFIRLVMPKQKRAGLLDAVRSLPMDNGTVSWQEAMTLLARSVPEIAGRIEDAREDGRERLAVTYRPCERLQRIY